jgi:xylulokinase
MVGRAASRGVDDVILAYDLGTTGNKAGLYDAAGHVVATAFAGYDTTYAHPGWAEQDPNAWWASVCDATRALLAAARVDSRAIRCVGFSGQMMGCLPVDRLGRPLRSAIIWADTRATDEADLIARTMGTDEVYAVTGNRVSSSYTLAKMLWVKDRQPAVWRETDRILQAKDHIVQRLTGVFVTDHSDASLTLALDLAGLCWAEPMLERLGIDAELMPRLRRSIDVVGEVTTTAAEATGLAAGTPVVIGGGDGACAAAGAGVLCPGAAYAYIGSSSWIGVASERPILDPARRTFNIAHVVPGLYQPIGTMQAAGASYQWARDQLCERERLDAGADVADRAGGLGGAGGVGVYERMNVLATTVPPGCDGLLFLPYLLGERAPRWNPLARGAYLGLGVSHERAHLVRAVLEGVAFNLRTILDAFIAQGVGIEAVRVIGGGAKSALWRQIIADVFERPVPLLELQDEATSLGAAMAGGVGIGFYPEFATLAPRVVETREPDRGTREIYRRAHAAFEKAYVALEPLFPDLAAVAALSEAARTAVPSMAAQPRLP